MIRLFESFHWMFEDDRVRLKIFLQGLIFAIPVVGQLALLGWTMSTYDNVRRGNQSMARVGFPVLRGLRVLVPAVLYYLLISIPEVILFVLRLLLPTSAVLADAVQVYNYVGLALYALVLVPAIVVADRDGLAAAADVRNVLRAMAARPEATLVVGAGVVIASTIAFMGFILVVGVLFTSVYAAAVVGGLSAWWHAQVFPEEVAAGGRPPAAAAEVTPADLPPLPGMPAAPRDLGAMPQPPRPAPGPDA